MSQLQLEHVSKKFPGASTPAVRDLTLSIAHGEIFTLLGPSGCGKTTTLRIIAGFERPDRGSIAIAGKRVAGAGVWVAPERRGVGMVFQDYALFPHLTVAENAAFGLHRLKSAAAAAAARRALELVGLRGLESRYPHELSGGQQQRVALARALAPEPAVILMDEPFSNLDQSLRSHISQELRGILRRIGTTALIVMHDQRDALSLSDRIGVMHQGALLQVGTPRDIYQAPRSLFVAQFLGQTNILTGVWRDGVVETELGPVPCHRGDGRPPGSHVIISVRPDSFEVAPDGPFAGRVESVMYGGNVCELKVTLVNGQRDARAGRGAGGATGPATAPRAGAGAELLIHCHPEMPVREGDTVRFNALPDFVAVVDSSAQR